MPEQVQDFLSHAVHVVNLYGIIRGLDPRNMKPVYVPRNPHEKAMQRALIQYRDPKLYDLVYEALRKAGENGSCRIWGRNVSSARAQTKMGRRTAAAGTKYAGKKEKADGQKEKRPQKKKNHKK